MQYALIISGMLVVAIVLIAILRSFTSDARAQKDLDRYLSEPMSSNEIGRFYERYIGHLYEKEGYDVIYYGAIKGYSDFGRDLIVSSDDEVLIIQAKCWSRNKAIHEKEIYQLFGTMTHFNLTSEKNGRRTKAVFYTTAQFTSLAKQAAAVLGVELRTERLNRTYPMIKCSITPSGDKIYYLPTDNVYDRVKINVDLDEHFVRTVNQAVKKGFKRAS
jgi:Restriction endonuclease.